MAPRTLGRLALAALAALGLGEAAVRLAGLVSPGVHLLATGRPDRPARAYRSLEELVAAHAVHIAPHRAWFGHWSNALGFHDEEFVAPKPPGRRRVLAVGDSFTFGMVAYPDAVMTVAEAGLRARCGQETDLLNLGLVGADVRHYRTLVELGAPRYAPDLVLIGFFAGNDAPDLYRHVHDRSPVERALRRSHLWTLAKNAGRVLGAMDDARLAARAGPPPGPVPPSARGGAPVEGIAPVAGRDPALVGPVLGEDAHRMALAGELGRLYRPADLAAVATAWRPVLAALDGLLDAGRRAGARVAVALLPSVLQVDERLRAATVTELASRAHHRGLLERDIDPALPGAVLGAHTRARDVAFVDLTPGLAAAGNPADDPLYKRRDTHWTPRGNREAGRAVAAFLAPLLCPR